MRDAATGYAAIAQHHEAVIPSILICFWSPCSCRPDILDPATICCGRLTLAKVGVLSLSADQLLLACVAPTSIKFYSLPQLVHHQSDSPIYTLDLEQPALSFSFIPDSSCNDPSTFLLLSADRNLKVGSMVSGIATLNDQVEAACWSPSGLHLAYSKGNMMYVTAPDWRDTAFVVEVVPEDEGKC